MLKSPVSHLVSRATHISWSDLTAAVKSFFSGETSSDSLSVLHRLAIIYLMLPVAIWLVGWHQWWLGVPAAALLALALWRALQGSWKVSFRPTTFALMLGAACWVMATAAGGIFNVHNQDWIKHRGIFLDLARGEWPTRIPAWLADLAIYFPGDVELPGNLLRYYLGYYMAPGLLGKWLGTAALNWAVPLWTWCGAALMLLLFTRSFVGWKSLAAAAVLIFFSGMDILTVVFFQGWEWITFQLTWDGWPNLWLGRSFLEWDRHWEVKVQLLSHMVDMMWVPQHFIAGVLCALLLVQLHEHRRFLAVSGVVVGASVFWSPFVAAGLLPLIAVLVVKNGIWPFLRWQNIIVGLPLTALLIVYLTLDTGEIPHFWLWEFAGKLNVLRGLPVFYLLEFLVLAILLVAKRPNLIREPFFVAALATLLLLPLYYYGLHNDLVMRGLIPALVLLSLYCADVLLGKSQAGPRHMGKRRESALSGLIILVLALGSVGPIINLASANSQRDSRAFRYERFGPEISTAHLVSGPIVSQYLASEIPGWYRALLDEAAGENVSARSQLLIDSVFEVYLLNERNLVFKKDPCTREDTEAEFIMHIFPLEKGSRLHNTLDFAFAQGAGFLIGDTCVTTRALPNTTFGRVRAGQYTLDFKGQSWMGNFYTREFRDRFIAEAGKPIIQSKFDVYMSGERIMYSKTACSEEDVKAPFYLQVTPVDADKLSDDHREAGFESIEFGFSEHGGGIGESCLLVYELPDYAIARIATGQYVSGGGTVWEGSFSASD